MGVKCSVTEVIDIKERNSRERCHRVSYNIDGWVVQRR